MLKKIILAFVGIFEASGEPQSLFIYFFVLKIVLMIAVYVKRELPDESLRWGILLTS